MKKLICGCAISEDGDPLVSAGAVGIGHKLEQCDRCKPPPESATHFSGDIGRWVRFTESGNVESLMNGKWVSLKLPPKGLIPKFGGIVRD